MASLDEETAKAVLRQVEFYFSDSNIPTDEFLRKKMSESQDACILTLSFIYIDFF
ncbi:hypothetical protein Pint_12797 [Pistacia integerrima]|uniref:Uncharacterized protein n=1 Tax=Pistacia integerrima TaxID=434235 RepID=A0ACC0Y9I3_9ROSI|nr:hypothetical protein Pint_12797 [Pistacia integerrima]